MRTQIERGEQLAREAMTILRDVGDRPGALRAQFQLAIELQRLGGFDEGHRLAEEVVALHEDLGMRYLLAREKQMLAWFKTNLGLYEEACLVGQDVLAHCRAMGHLSGVAWCLCGLAEAVEAQGDYVQAKELLQQSLSIIRDYSWEGCTLVLLHLGHVERALGEHDEAHRHLAEALQRVTEIRASKPVLFSLSLFALLLADRGDIDRAIEVYALATRDPYAANSRFWEDRAGKHIAAAAATLPPEVVAAAQKRGRDRDLEATVAELLVELEVANERGEAQ
jgi:tetratricopeptide (TPR) repeat protein